MTPDDEPTPTDDTTDATDATSPDDEGVEAEGTLLEQSQATIDDAHEAVKRVDRTDAIGDDTIGIAVTDDEAAEDRATED